MIAVWMLYCLGIGLVFVVVGYAIERGMYLAGRPTRWAWVIALAGSCLVPATAWLRPEAFATFAAPIPTVVQSSSSSLTSTTSTILDQHAAPSFSISDLDAPLRWGWGLASVAILCTLAVAGTRLLSLRRRWRPATVDGRMVLVSRNVGPAVVGVWSPRVVLPEWALTLSASDRELMLAHEEQHLRAADPAVIALGFVLVLLAPWNLALWWQWRRLRLAVEMDCDARVLAEGGSAPAYGELLLRVGRRRTTRLVGAAAFGEPASFLESRIRRMLSGMPRWRWASAGAALVVAAGAMVGACEAPRPVVPDLQREQPADAMVHGDGVNSAQVRPLLTRYFGPNPGRLRDSAVIAWFVVNEPGAVIAWGKSPLTAPVEVLAIPQMSYRVIPGYDTLRVAAQLLQANRDLPPTIIVRLGDPSKKAPASPLPASVGRSGEFDMQAMRTRADQVRHRAQQYQPGAFASPQTKAAVALVMDSQDRVLGHAIGVRLPSDETCLDVLTRLLPEFRNAQWLVSGCMDGDPQGKVTVYWGTLLKR